jgi:hypothetical protein
MTIQLPESKQFTNPNNGNVLNTDKFRVHRIIDSPARKCVYAYNATVGRIKVQALSDAAYDSPQWTNESFVAALSAQLCA